MLVYGCQEKFYSIGHYSPICQRRNQLHNHLRMFRAYRREYDGEDEYDEDRRSYNQGISNSRYPNQAYSRSSYGSSTFRPRGGSRYEQRGGYGRGGNFEGSKSWARNDNSTIGETLRKPEWNQADLTPIAKDLYKPHPDVINRSDEEVKDYYRSKEITVTKNAPKPILSFEEANFPDYVMEEVR